MHTFDSRQRRSSSCQTCKRSGATTHLLLWQMQLLVRLAYGVREDTRPSRVCDVVTAARAAVTQAGLVTPDIPCIHCARALPSTGIADSSLTSPADIPRTIQALRQRYDNALSRVVRSNVHDSDSSCCPRSWHLSSHDITSPRR